MSLRANRSAPQGAFRFCAAVSVLLAAFALLAGAHRAEAAEPAQPARSAVQPAPHPDVPPLSPDSAQRPPSPEPEGFRIDGFRDPVPAKLTGAKLLTSAEAEALWLTRTAVFIDVYPRAPKPPNLPASTLWREPTHHSIENSVWLPNTGFGVLAGGVEDYFKAHLERLSGGDKAKPLVFYCLRNCWMSWNAAKRAMGYGYSAVHWYPDGTDGWQEIGQLVVETKPEP